MLWEGKLKSKDSWHGKQICQRAITENLAKCQLTWYEAIGWTEGWTLSKVVRVTGYSQRKKENKTHESVRGRMYAKWLKTQKYTSDRGVEKMWSFESTYKHLIYII